MDYCAYIYIVISINIKKTKHYHIDPTFPHNNLHFKTNRFKNTNQIFNPHRKIWKKNPNKKHKCNRTFARPIPVPKSTPKTFRRTTSVSFFPGLGHPRRDDGSLPFIMRKTTLGGPGHFPSFSRDAVAGREWFPGIISKYDGDVSITRQCATDVSRNPFCGSASMVYCILGLFGYII